MATTVTFDKVTPMSIHLNRNPGEDTEPTIEYVLSTSDNRFPQSRSITIPPASLTAGQRSTLNAVWDRLVTGAKTAEGIP